MPKIVGWVAELLDRIVRKHGPTQDGRIPSRKWYEWLEHMKREDEKEKMEDMHQR